MSATSVTINAPTSKIIIAVDFGTTCSSLGYVHTSEPEGGKIIKKWPDSIQTTEWVPTTIEYDDEDDPASYRWGYQIEDNEMKYEWFKLGLDPELQLSGLGAKYKSRTALPPVQGTECERLVTDYLKGLKQHADHYMTEKFDAVFLKNRKPQYIITVPAIWSEKAQAATRQCAISAGMGKSKIQIITEPEAAGIYALKNMKLGLTVGETFVLCDAGGGTVDLISYTVDDLGKIPVLTESAPGSGGLCGSTFLNRIFDEFLRQKFEGYNKWDEGYHQDAMHRFEIKIKREFNGDLKKSFYVPARGLGHNAALGIVNGQVEITGKRLHKIFAPVITEVLTLVKAQLDATDRKVTAILLAGGFGTSKYLRKQIEESVGDIKVIPIEDGDTAIVRGALIRGLAERSPKLATIRIGARVARKHYGTLAYEGFDPDKHDHSRKEEDELAGGYRIQVMKWFITKGTTVKESDPAKFGFYWDKIVAEGRPTTIQMTIYSCESSQDSGSPMYADNRDIKKLVELKADVTSIPVEEFEQEPGVHGKMYYKLDFEIVMTCRSGSLKFGIVYKDKSYDTVEQKFV